MTPAIFLVGELSFDRLAASYRRAFASLGVTVEGFDTTELDQSLAWPARQRVVRRFTRRSLALRRFSSRRLNETLLGMLASSNADWALLLSGEWVMPETIERIQRLGKRVAIFHSDNPLPPHYNHRPETLDCARHADLYLIWGERLADALRRVGVTRARFLPFGWDPEVFPYQGDRPQGTWPGVVFVGGWDREREAFLDEVARHVPLRIYGPPYWSTRTRSSSRARACWQGGALTMDKAAKALRDAAVSLNILRGQHMVAGVPDGTIMRHFEVPGAGGFLLSTRSESATRLFREGESAAYFEGVDDCIEKCRHYLEAGAERRAVAERAHADVSAAHQYRHRAQEILAAMGGAAQ